jgi:hypothetical protein
MATLCEELEYLPLAGEEQDRAEAALRLAQLWPLLERITEHIMQNTTFASDT